jgi:hypothetical protein
MVKGNKALAENQLRKWWSTIDDGKKKIPSEQELA